MASRGYFVLTYPIADEIQGPYVSWVEDIEEPFGYGASSTELTIVEEQQRKSENHHPLVIMKKQSLKG